MTDEVKATVISLFPLAINEPKPGLYPGYFNIPAAPLGDISFLVVGDSLYYTETRNDQVLPVRTAYFTVADSIVNDFMSCHIGRILSEDPDEAAEPGLFWVHGAHRNKEIIKEEFYTEIAVAEKKQNNWLQQLIMIADDTYSRTGRSSSVSALQRLAAKRLNIARPWMIRTGDSSNSCPFCKAEMPFGAIKCPNCREIVDQVAYRNLVDSMTLNGNK